MNLARKALYNLLLINRIHDADSKLANGTELESWQLENYREWTSAKLIKGLHDLNINFELSDFEVYAKNYDTPEDMADSLSGDLDHKSQDKAYLILFELWRRLLPEKPSISIFGDELDHQILFYDRGETKNPADIQDSIAYLQHLLDENVDAGVSPEDAFEFIQNHCANDLESFLFDYILEEIEAGNASYASELLEGFSRYLQETLWFDYLKIRLEFLKESEESAPRLCSLIEEVESQDQLELNLEILQFLAKRADRGAFVPFALKTIRLIDHQEDFEDFLTICQLFFHETDSQQEEKKIQDLAEKRLNHSDDQPLKKSDADFTLIKELLSNSI